ncbi:MAG TPA: amidohydrolase family protein [Candidatus Binatia bacterium]|jgi:aminocarboxymuconate-semialdehyde decarboxylase
MAKPIDIHHHYVPREVIDEARRTGKSLGVEVAELPNNRVGLAFGGGKPHMLQPALMDVEKRLEIMAKGKVAIAALEANTNSLGYRLTGEQGESWCRLYNDGVQQLVKKCPDRFVATAAVPLQEPARAAKVLRDAVGKQKFSAAFIGTNVNGRYYNSKDFDPFWAAAEETDVLIVMHPEHIAGAERMTEYGLNAVCGNPADSTLSLGYLIYSGVFDRFPRLKLCALHGGGFFPYHMGRFDQEYATGKGARPADCKSPPSAYLKNLYFDTLVYDVDTLDYLRRKVGGERLVVGTDYPYTLGDWMGVEKVEALDCPAKEKEAILEGTARRLLKL